MMRYETETTDLELVLVMSGRAIWDKLLERVVEKLFPDTFLKN